MSIKSFFSNFLLNRLASKSLNATEKNYVFEQKNNSALLILPYKEGLEITKTKLSHLAKPYFSSVDFLIIGEILQSGSSDRNDTISLRDLSFSGKFNKKDFKLSIRDKYDIVVNFYDIADPTLELFIAGIGTPLRIRFDRINEKFYNFIVPIEIKDISTRFEQFLKVYQTLKK